MKTIFSIIALMLILCQCSTYKWGLSEPEQELAIAKYCPDYQYVSVLENDGIFKSTGKVSLRIIYDILFLGLPELGYKNLKEEAFRKYLCSDKSYKPITYASITALEPDSSRLPQPTLNEQELFKASGTGFSVSPYRIVTAYHVVENADSIQVQFNYEPWQNAELELMDESLDIAVLKLSKPHEYFLTFSDTPPGLGDKIFSIGFPFTELLGNEAKFTEGTLSSFTGLFNDPSLYQITIPIQPGNSGGPVVTENGVLVGMAVSSASDIKFLKITGSLPQNVNYAVKGNYIRTLIERKEKLSMNPPSLSRKSSIRLTQDSVCKIKSEGKKSSK